MCVVSMVGDHFSDKWKQPLYQEIFTNIPEVSRAEFELLKKEVEEMKQLLKRAKEYDEKNNEPNCEIEEKMTMLRKFAEAVGVTLDDVIVKNNNENNSDTISLIKKLEKDYPNDADLGKNVRKLLNNI